MDNSVWKYVIKLEDRFGPEHVRVFVEDGRVRVSGQREISVGGNDDVMECLNISREITPPAEVDLEGLTVMFRDGGRLVLEAPRVQNTESETGCEENVVQAGNKTEEPKQDEHKTDIDEIKMVENPDNSDTDDKTVDETSNLESEMEITIIPENKETSPEIDNEEKDIKDIDMKDTEPEQKIENAEKDNSKDKETGESSTTSESRIQERPKHSVPAARHEDEAQPGSLAETSTEPGTLGLKVYTEEQQQTQMDESDNQLLVMNVAGFEPNQVKVKVEGRRATVKASQHTEEDGFYSRREYFRSFLLPEGVTSGHVTCSIVPSTGRLVITNMTQQ